MSSETGERFHKIANEVFDGSLSDLARALGMKPGSFSKYSSGKTMPGGSILKRLIALDINLNWFLAGIPPMRISDIDEAQVSQVNFVNETEKDYFEGISREDLSDAERHLLEEVKHFSDFLESRQTLAPRVKRLLLELLIQSIDQAIEQPQHDPDDS